MTARVWCPCCGGDATYHCEINRPFRTYWECVACNLQAPPKTWAELMRQRLAADSYAPAIPDTDSIQAALRGGESGGGT